MEAPDESTPKTEKPGTTFGSIYPVPGSSKLYYRFRYFGEPVRFSSGFDDTQENRKKLRVFLDLIHEEISAGTFCYAERFPDDCDSRKEKFSRLEGNSYRPEPKDVFFGDQAKKWMAKKLTKYPVQTQEDYKSIINHRLIPMLGRVTFEQINGDKMEDFLEELRHEENGSKAGRYLSVKSIRNIIIPLRAIFKNACETYQWHLIFPQDSIEKKIKHIKTISAGEGYDADDVTREVLLLTEWLQVRPHFGSHYRPIFEAELMSGMIFSEIKGLKKEHIIPGYIEVSEANIKGKQKKCLKKESRRRCIPLTTALRGNVEKAIANSGDSDYVFTMEDGSPLDYKKLNDIWQNAFKKAGLPHKVQYALRHTFTEWSLLLGITRSRLQKIMGHASRKMVDEHYGGYRNGLISEKTAILNFMGTDFLDPEELQAGFPVLYSRSVLEAPALPRDDQLAPQPSRSANQILASLMQIRPHGSRAGHPPQG